MNLEIWRAWPLLAAGLAVLGIDVALLVEAGDKGLAAALLMGVGAVMVGAGIANVLRHPPKSGGNHRRDHDE